MRRYLIAAGLVALVLPARAQLLTHKDLSLAIALEIAKTAYDQCTAEGYGVSVVVVDRAGETLVALRGDKAGPHTLENARRKAYTARTFRTPTSAYAKKYESGDAGDGDDVGQRHLLVHDGVDEPCVQAGIDKVADQLK